MSAHKLLFGGMEHLAEVAVKRGRRLGQLLEILSHNVEVGLSLLRQCELLSLLIDGNLRHGSLRAADVATVAVPQRDGDTQSYSKIVVSDASILVILSLHRQLWQTLTALPAKCMLCGLLLLAEQLQLRQGVKGCTLTSLQGEIKARGIGESNMLIEVHSERLATGEGQKLSQLSFKSGRFEKQVGAGFAQLIHHRCDALCLHSGDVALLTLLMVGSENLFCRGYFFVIDTCLLLLIIEVHHSGVHLSAQIALCHEQLAVGSFQQRGVLFYLFGVLATDSKGL